MKKILQLSYVQNESIPDLLNHYYRYIPDIITHVVKYP